MGHARYVFNVQGKLPRLNVDHKHGSIGARLRKRGDFLFSDAAHGTRQAMFKKNNEPLL